MFSFLYLLPPLLLDKPNYNRHPNFIPNKKESLEVEFEGQPESIVLDPNEWTLFEDMVKL
ncbi:hypothetical protein [Flagellimonas sp. GZD32]|uniref:hypothetical protein n=1 Tax=Flagellimonas cixiensis TaxID=3228750 RepID=UPI0035C8B577